MQALSRILAVVRPVAAASLGLLLAWMTFCAWTKLVPGAFPNGSPSPAASARDTSGTPPSRGGVVSAGGSQEASDGRSAVIQVSGGGGSSHEESSHSEPAHEEPAAEEEVETNTVPTQGPPIIDEAYLEAGNEPVARLLEQADRAYDNGSLAECVRRFQFLLPNTQGMQRRLVAIKLGVASENLSDLETASQAYAASLESHPSDELASLARLRIGVILASQGNVAEARSHLCDWLLSGGMSNQSNYEQQGIHLLSEVQARIACGSTEDDTKVNLACLELDRPVWPFLHDAPLLELKELEAALARPNSDPAAGQTQIEIVDQLSPALEETFFAVQVARRPLSGVCDALARKAGQSLAWTEGGYQRASERHITVSLDGVNLAAIFDLLTRGTGLVWLQTDDGVVIAAESDLSAADVALVDSAAARRMLQFAIAAYPDNERMRSTSLSLANLDFHEHRLADASARYQELVQGETDRMWTTEAAFNLGKVRLLHNDLRGAANAFLRSSDVALGHPLQPAALMYAGRVHVDLNRISQSVPLFSRAWTLSRGGELEPEALICLCSIYAYLGNPMGASRILMDHRDVVRDVGHYHDLAAFIGCYCRYSLARTNDRKMRDGRDLLDALSNIDPQTFFSAQGWALMIESYHKLGLDQESQSILQECLVKHGDSPFRNALVHGEASGTAEQGEPATPMSIRDAERFAALLGEESLHRMEHIRQMLNTGEHEALEVEAELLLRAPLTPAMQVEVLDALGQSYQRAGNHYDAALCFARINPFSDEANRLRREFLQEHSLEVGAPAP